MREEAVLFGKEKTLVGTITIPERAANGIPAVILLNAGLVHRVGPNRVYVKVARRLAQSGIVVFRFDRSGLGDSAVRSDHLPADESAILETKEAMDYLSTSRGIERFVLMGICSGAEISAQTACSDDRVAGAILVNTLYHQFSAAIRDKVQVQYYNRFASQRLDKWLKVLTGKADYRKIWTALKTQIGNRFGADSGLPAASSKFELSLQDMLRTLQERRVPLLLISNETPFDFVYLEMLAPGSYRQMLQTGQLQAEIIEHAGHTFPLLTTQEELSQRVQNWVSGLQPVAPEMDVIANTQSMI